MPTPIPTARAVAAALAAALLATDTASDRAALDQHPVLHGLHDLRDQAEQAEQAAPGSTTPTGGPVHSTALPVPDRVWYAHPDGIAGALTDVAAVLSSPAGAAGLARIRARTGAYLAGWAVTYHDVHISGRRLLRVHRIDAADTAGRYYRLTRPAGSGHITVEHQPATGSAIHTALAAIVSASRHPATRAWP